MPSQSHFERSRDLSWPGKGDWHGYVAYEATWDAFICDPDPPDIYTILNELETVRGKLSWLKFLMNSIQSTVVEARKVKV
jgi:hypothetical protein